MSSINSPVGISLTLTLLIGIVSFHEVSWKKVLRNHGEEGQESRVRLDPSVEKPLLLKRNRTVSRGVDPAALPFGSSNHIGYAANCLVGDPNHDKSLSSDSGGNFVLRDDRRDAEWQAGHLDGAGNLSTGTKGEVPISADAGESPHRFFGQQNINREMIGDAESRHSHSEGLGFDWPGLHSGTIECRPEGIDVSRAPCGQSEVSGIFPAVVSLTPDLASASYETVPDGDGIILNPHDRDRALLRTTALANLKRSTFSAKTMVRAGDSGAFGIDTRNGIWPVTRKSGMIWDFSDNDIVPAPIPKDDRYFPQVLDFSGNTAVVADGGSPSRHVFVFSMNSRGFWRQQARIASPIAGNHGFGAAIGVSGNHLAISAAYPLLRSDNVPVTPESVWLYERIAGTWSLKQRITSPVPLESNFFGTEIDIENDLLAVSSDSEDNIGEVYVYRKSASGWVLEQGMKALVPNATGIGGFRRPLAVSDGKVYVAGNISAQGGTPSACLFVFSRSNGSWGLHQTILIPEDVQAGVHTTDTAITVSGTHLILGLPNAGTVWPVYSKGRAMAFRLKNGLWEFSQTIYPSDLGSDDTFGTAVAVSSAGLMIRCVNKSSYYPSDPGRLRDYFYVDSAGTWVQRARIPAEGTSHSGHQTLAISGEIALATGGKLPVSNRYGIVDEMTDSVAVRRLTQEATVMRSESDRLNAGKSVVHYLHMPVGYRGAIPFTVRNTGLLPLSGLRAKVENYRKSDFSLVGKLPELLNPGQSAQIKVAFQARRPGKHSGRLTVISNDTDEGLFRIGLKADVRSPKRKP